MIRFIIIGVILLLSSCEYNSEIILSNSLPLIVTTKDKVSIKRFTLEELRSDNNTPSTIFEWVPSQITTTIFLDSIFYKVKINGFKNFNPESNYSINLKTSKGFAFVDFKVDNNGNVTLIRN